ncbi:MAG: hypothetical protein H7240_12915 [Glaciimonas sp.]|nr:hypothetical protein [Glaciimonas sp.]
MNLWGETPTLALEGKGYLSETASIARYLDQQFPRRKIIGNSPLEQGQGTMWENRIWIHILYHIIHQGLGPKLELTHNPRWDKHCWRPSTCHSCSHGQNHGISKD